MALPAGIAPASIRLEDECLVYSATAAERDGLMDYWINGLMGTRSGAQTSIQQSIYPLIHSEMVSAAGLAPANPRSQAERVGCYTTR